MANAGG